MKVSADPNFTGERETGTRRTHIGAKLGLMSVGVYCHRRQLVELEPHERRQLGLSEDAHERSAFYCPLEYQGG